MASEAVIDPPTLGRTSQHFVEFLREADTPAPVLSPKRFSQAMHIDLQTLVELAHVHRNTISRAPGSRGVQDFLREALRVIKAATDLAFRPFTWPWSQKPLFAMPAHGRAAGCSAGL